jgi:FkbM family methyltransferase
MRGAELATAALLDTPKHADLIFDVGMHKGEDAEFYLRKGFRVVGIEADPALAAGCAQRLAAFVRDGRLALITGAVARAADAPGGAVLFYRNERFSVWGTTSAAWAERNARLGAVSTVVTVPAVDMVEVLRSHGVPHYMKIDIEGADVLCLEALAHFRERPDYVSLESDKRSLAAVDRELGLLESLGYDGFQAIEQSAIPVRQAPPEPAREGTFIAWQFAEGASGLFGAELPNEWRTRAQILRRYRVVCAGYQLFGDDGIAHAWTWPGARMLRRALRRVMAWVTGNEVPGWYDTHARLGQ